MRNGQAYAPTRTQVGSSLTYAAGLANLLLQLNTGTDTVAGTFSAPIAMNYFVLTRDTTQANFGGLAAANNFCLNQLRNNTFKGKVNATLDAAHVFAFLCDNSAATIRHLTAPFHSRWRAMPMDRGREI